MVARLTSQPCAVRDSRAAIGNEAGRSLRERRPTVIRCSYSCPFIAMRKAKTKNCSVEAQRKAAVEDQP